MKKNITLSLKKTNSSKFRSIATIILSTSFIFLFLNCTHTNKKSNDFFDNNEDKLSLNNNGISKLRFINKRIDFGNVPKDTLLIHRFNFLNTSNNNLIINHVNPDCICTGYTLSNDTILPGDTAYIELKFDTQNKYGKQKIYTIVSANTKPKLNKLTLLANVKNK